MGTIRILLAICVLMGHMGLQKFEFMPVGTGLFASYAVQAFFIISGFYMCLVLSGKYQSSRLADFYRTRFSKIIPLYWVSLVMMMMLYFGVHQWGVDFFDYLYSGRIQEQLYPLVIVNPSILERDWVTLGGFVVLFATQLVLIGQEWVYFLTTDGQGIGLVPQFVQTSDYLDHSFPVVSEAGQGVRLFVPTLDTPTVFMSSYLFIPQAWSLSHELMFYLMVPFLAKLRTRSLIFLTLLFLLARIYFLEFHNSQAIYYFEFKFFPFVLCFFLMGMLSYRLFEYVDFSFLKGSRKFRLPAISVLVVAMFAVGNLPGYSNWAFYALLFLLMPLAFEGSDVTEEIEAKGGFRYNLNKLDRRVGELAYPLYTSHVGVLLIMYALIPDFTHQLGSLWSSSIVLISSLALAFFLLKTVQDPVDRYRRDRLSNTNPPTRAERRRGERQLLN